MDYTNTPREELIEEIEDLKGWIQLIVQIADAEHYEHIVLEYSEYRGSLGFEAHKKDRPNCRACELIETFRGHLKTGVFPRKSK